MNPYFLIPQLGSCVATGVSILGFMHGDAQMASVAGGMAVSFFLSAIEVTNRANRNSAPIPPNQTNSKDTKPKPEP